MSASPTFRPYDSLRNRTFIGLIVAQFLAAFNDQCIHAAAMFYAIRSDTLTEAQAITLMPILFYLPWALFCTLAGYLADRFTKQASLIFWKASELVITGVALLGFYLGTGHNHALGPWLVLASVFLMGTHSAFFVPAKYGVMPEILSPALLSKGNGILESTSFLAVILGTVSGGILSFVFSGAEYWIGVLLFGLALVGTAASFLIQWVPPANPTRPFPWNPLTPLGRNLHMLWRSRPLALAVLGIAFFTFMVAFMRATVYMHGEAHHWTEFKTSLVVAFVGLGIGIGSPLAGYLSGHKVELGLVPIGAVGMILATAGAGLAMNGAVPLVICIIVIGFCAGFYIVPLYTLLQHRAPKTSKGDLVATSNFINVTGAIVASVLFFGLEMLAKRTGLAYPLEQQAIAEGKLVELSYRQGRPWSFVVVADDGVSYRPGPVAQAMPDPEAEEDWFGWDTYLSNDAVIVVRKRGLFTRLQPGDRVVISRYELGQREYLELRPAELPAEPAYDLEQVPRYLFFAASLMTLGILMLLCRKLPDFFIRSLLWLRSYGRYHIRVVGIKHLPAEGAAVLVTNCHRFQDSMHVLAATDRHMQFILIEEEADDEPTALLRFLARRTSLIVLKPGVSSAEEYEAAYRAAAQALQEEKLVAISAPDSTSPPAKMLVERIIENATHAPVVPVYCGTLSHKLQEPVSARALRRIRVIFGEPLPPRSSVAEVRQALAALGDWFQTVQPTTTFLASAEHPECVSAWPRPPAGSRPQPPSRD